MGEGDPMAEIYHHGHRLLQDRFDTRRLADRIDQRLVSNVIDAEDKAFIEGLDMFFLATADEQGYRTAPTREASPASCGYSTSTRWPSPTTTATGCTCRPGTSWQTPT